MIEKMLANIMPVLVMQLTRIPMKQKQVFAQFIADISQAYANGDRLSFDHCLEDTSLPLDTKLKITGALWNEDKA